MKFSVSNIAWPTSKRSEAYALLKSYGIRGLEIAPALFLHESSNPFAPSPEQIAVACDLAQDAGLELVSMQSLLFGVSDAALFEDVAALDRFCAGMHSAIALAQRLNIPNLVFGSPLQRNIPSSFSPGQAESRALTIFRRLGDEALAAGTKLGMEFNPQIYGTNFLNTGDEALSFVQKVDHPAISLILDIGAMHINGDFDQIEEFAGKASSKISHVHLSEPRLAPAPADSLQAARVISALLDVGYDGWFSIEMKKTPENSLQELEKSIRILLEATEGQARS